MITYKIAVIAGDGIGPEVIAEAVKVLKAVAAVDNRFSLTFTEFPWGCEYYLKTGQMMPEDGIEILSKYNAILLGAAIAGGMGLAAGANINPERRYPSMFEAIHGSAPDIAGRNIANPLASVWTAGQMLDFFGYEDWGRKIVDSIERMLVEKKALTPDLGGTASTQECGDEMVRILTEG